MPWQIYALRFLCTIAVVFLPFTFLMSLITRLNKYGMGNEVISSDGIWDCDVDAEAGIQIMAFPVWAIALVLLGVSIKVKAWRNAKICWLLTLASAGIAVHFVLRFLTIIQYHRELAELCSL